jgi:hypothetical protein
MGEFSNFERGHILDARLAGASVAETSSLLSALRATVSEVMLTYMNHWENKEGEDEQGRKSTLTERDRRTLRRTVSKNNGITAA